MVCKSDILQNKYLNEHDLHYTLGLLLEFIIFFGKVRSFYSIIDIDNLKTG